LITSLRANAVLVPEEDWNAIQETLYLLSVSAMRESIRVGLETPIEECERARLVNDWNLVYTRQAQKDAKRLAASGLRR